MITASGISRMLTSERVCKLSGSRGCRLCWLVPGSTCKNKITGFPVKLSATQASVTNLQLSFVNSGTSEILTRKRIGSPTRTTQSDTGGAPVDEIDDLIEVGHGKIVVLKEALGSDVGVLCHTT